MTADHNEEAYQIAEKLRAAVEALKLDHNQNPASAHMSVSVGIKTHRCSGSHPAEMSLIYRLADDALYQAKELGRNQVAVSPVSLTSEGNDRAESYAQ